MSIFSYFSSISEHTLSQLLAVIGCRDKVRLSRMN